MSNPENKRLDDDLLEFLNDFQEFEKDHDNCKKECEQLEAKLLRAEDEVKAARDMERSHRYNLGTSTKIIADLQNNLSCFVGLKCEVKDMSEVVKNKDNIILDKEEEIAKLIGKQNEEMVKIKRDYEQKTEQVLLECETKMKNYEDEMDIKVAQATCEVGELNNKIKRMEDESRERINVLVLDCEEQLVKAHAQARQLRDEITAVITRSHTNIEVYQKKIAELEEKLKESQIKECKDIGAHLPIKYQPAKYNTYPEQIETNTLPRNLGKDCNKNKQITKNNNSFTPLTIIWKENTGNDNINADANANASENRTGFNIVKKRKLFNNTVEGDFKNFQS